MTALIGLLATARGSITNPKFEPQRKIDNAKKNRNTNKQAFLAPFGIATNIVSILSILLQFCTTNMKNLQYCFAYYF